MLRVNFTVPVTRIQSNKYRACLVHTGCAPESLLDNYTLKPYRVDCKADCFAKFLIERNCCGIKNNFMELDASYYETDDEPKTKRHDVKQYYVVILDEDGGQRHSVYYDATEREIIDIVESLATTHSSMKVSLFEHAGSCKVGAVMWEDRS